MKKIATVSFEDVKTILRRGDGGSIRNHGGWCVYINKQGSSFYVVDSADSRPVPYQRIGPIRAQRVPTPPIAVSSYN